MVTLIKAILIVAIIWPLIGFAVFVYVQRKIPFISDMNRVDWEDFFQDLMDGPLGPIEYLIGKHFISDEEMEYYADLYDQEYEEAEKELKEWKENKDK